MQDAWQRQVFVRWALTAAVGLGGGCSDRRPGRPSVGARAERCRLCAIELRAGMTREQVERQVAVALGEQPSYSPHGNNLRGGTVRYRDGNWVLSVTFKPGAPAPLFSDEQGHSGHFPPIDETVLEYRIVDETSGQTDAE